MKLLGEVKERLNKQSSNLTNTFLYLMDKPIDRMARVASFYDDFLIMLDKIVPTIKPNSYTVWTIGNRQVGGVEIPNDRILIDFLVSRNFTFVSEINREIRNKRMPNKNPVSSTMKSEKILIFRTKGG